MTSVSSASEGFQPDMVDEPHHVLDADEGYEGFFRWKG